MNESVEILKEDLENLKEKLSFQTARADLMEFCDCTLPYNNIKWALNYIRKHHLGGAMNYYTAGDYLLDALKLEFEMCSDENFFKESVKSEGLLMAIGEKMIQDANSDLKELHLSLDEVSIRSDGVHLYLHLGNFEKDFFIEAFKNYKDNDLKQELLEKHKVLFDELELTKELEEFLKNKNQVFSKPSDEQRNARLKR